MSATTIKTINREYLSAMSLNDTLSLYNSLANLGQRYGEKGNGITTKRVLVSDMVETEDDFVDLSTITPSYKAIDNGEYTNINLEYTQNGVNITYTFDSDNYEVSINSNGYILYIYINDTYKIIRSEEGTYTATINGTDYNVTFNLSGDELGWTTTESSIQDIIAKFNDVYTTQLYEVIDIYNELFTITSCYTNILYELYNTILGIDFADNNVDETLISEEIYKVYINKNTEFVLSVSDNTSNDDNQALLTNLAINVNFVESKGTANTVYVETSSGLTKKVVSIDFCINPLQYGEYTINKYNWYVLYQPYIGQVSNTWYINNQDSGISALGLDADQLTVIFVRTYIDNDGNLTAKTVSSINDVSLSFDTDNPKQITQSILVGATSADKKMVYVLPSTNAVTNINNLTRIKNSLIINISNVYIGDNDQYTTIALSNFSNSPIRKNNVTFWNYVNDDWSVLIVDDSTEEQAYLDYDLLDNLQSIRDYIADFDLTVVDNRIKEHIFDEGVNLGNGKVSDNNDYGLTTKNSLFRTGQFKILALLNDSNNGLFKLIPFVSIDGGTYNDSTFYSGNTPNFYCYPEIDLASVMLANSMVKTQLNILSDLPCSTGANTAYNMRIGAKKDVNGAFSGDFEISYLTNAIENGNLIPDFTYLSAQNKTLYIGFRNLDVSRVTTKSLIQTSSVNSKIHELLTTYTSLSNSIFGHFIFNLDDTSFNTLLTNIDETNKYINKGDILANRIICGDFNLEDNDCIEYLKKNTSRSYIEYLDSLDGQIETVLGNELKYESGSITTLNSQLITALTIKVGSNIINSFGGAFEKLTANLVNFLNGTITNLTSDTIQTETLKSKTASIDLANIPQVIGNWTKDGSFLTRNITAFGTVSTLSLPSTTILYSVIGTTGNMFVCDTNGNYYLNLGKFANEYIRYVVTGSTLTNEWSDYSSLFIYMNDLWFVQLEVSPSVSLTGSVTQGTASNMLGSGYTAHYINSGTAVSTTFGKNPLLKLLSSVDTSKTFVSNGRTMAYPEFNVILYTKGTQVYIKVTEVIFDNYEDVYAKIQEEYEASITREEAIYKKIDDLLNLIDTLRKAINTTINYSGNGGTVVTT